MWGRCQEVKRQRIKKYDIYGWEWEEARGEWTDGPNAKNNNNREMMRVCLSIAGASRRRPDSIRCRGATKSGEKILFMYKKEWILWLEICLRNDYQGRGERSSIRGLLWRARRVKQNKTRTSHVPVIRPRKTISCSDELKHGRVVVGLRIVDDRRLSSAVGVSRGGCSGWSEKLALVHRPFR